MRRESEQGPASAIWASADDDTVLFDEDCSPTKTCRNMVGISFDGFAEPGTSLPESWRATLEREGKIAEGSGSLRDLVLGNPGT